MPTIAVREEEGLGEDAHGDAIISTRGNLVATTFASER